MTNKPESLITIIRSAGRTRICVTGRYVLPMLEALANGAPSGEAAAFAAWFDVQPRNTSGGQS
ncbi:MULTISPECIES: hypothetical protein [pseudomallei group]|uniref:hypothetical protein n=1 Tax=pseudomallei group TaxID=111527 RepID=UPI00016ADF70|nr:MULTISPECIES: hypothetical protein [pseudomallei group]AJX83294.1 hypothetical protein BG97_4841 [Burkholderia pseudomallei 7894]ARK42893.1 hypothetical protein BOC60_21785 [Burkholderia pseudomallei]ARK71258.1 hypothetical protein BOC38_32930 [Burkholderia pseudomallei]ARK77809.1 hypothetical protein BOC39_31490 [Burkholderia pseudomallei]ARL19274.1 hypothetical protein BOC46_28390 [Burkholderia pseudomallei]